MLREIIEIDESLCDGCGQCIPACHEGALQVIDEKARLISDLMCDGLGACVGHCPTGAMTVVQREATPYDERIVMENIIQGGTNVIKAHLEHMIEHDEMECYLTALQVLSEKNIPVPEHKKSTTCCSKENKNSQSGDDKGSCKCAGSKESVQESAHTSSHSHSKSDKSSCKCSGSKESNQGITDTPSHSHNKSDKSSCKCESSKESNLEPEPVSSPSQPDQCSELTHWPIQLHLINPTSPTFNEADLLLAADCSAFAAGDFHSRYLAGKKLLIACPKLDTNQDAYIEKLGMLIRYGQLKSLTILRMEVPCCGGLEKLVKKVITKANNALPLTVITINKVGEVIGTQE